ncbi:metal-dependent hydrolase [Candidatus Dojkabacteria bacterium]|nr:metal-dependent hydrolase [Candidatus Dojkabacteria bacterium]
MFLAHGPLSTIITEKVRERYFKGLDRGMVPFLIVISLIAGLLPDFDFFILAAQSIPSFLHHNLVTHTPIFWIVVSMLVYAVLKVVEKYTKSQIGTILRNGGSAAITLTVLIGTLSHIFSDMLTGHIMLLYPFTDYAFTLTADLLPLNPIVSYFIHPFMILEIVIIAVFMGVMIKLLFPVSKKLMRTTSILFSLIITIVFFLSLYLHQNTYNPTLPRLKNNMINYDVDNDYIDDYLDFDIGNNGWDNVMDKDRNRIAQVARKVGNSKKLAVTDNPFLERLGYTSDYGLISTTYFQAGYTLEPVIKNYFKEETDIKYNLESYHRMLKERQLLTSFDPELNRQESNIESKGKTLFILKEGKVISAGIIINRGKVAIVLPNDRRLTLHSFEEVKNTYTEGITFEIEGYILQ